MSDSCLDRRRGEQADPLTAPAPASTARRHGVSFLLRAPIAVVVVASILAGLVLGSCGDGVGTVLGPAAGAQVGITTTIEVSASTTAASPATTTAAPPTSTTLPPTTTTVYTHAIASPSRIVIPAIGVDAETVAVGIAKDGGMEVPKVGLTGWYRLGPAPGAPGPAVIVSHVSYGGKKGVFYDLKRLEPGDEILIYGDNGDHAVVIVDSKEITLKTELPTERIWNKTQDPVIRLVTCGGRFDPKTRHYLSNVIVYGHLLG
jgi:sortase (surface protein transpeptidase)